MDEGYIKFTCEWTKTPAPDSSLLTELILWRQKLFSAGLIGAYSNGIGFGNISVRSKITPREFIISGSATGGVKEINAEHFTLVKDYSFDHNLLLCSGPIKASSESLTHAAVYKAVPSANAVIHIHSKSMWLHFLDKLPTTKKYVSFGTPEMAFEVLRLVKETDVLKTKCFVMGGHEEGIIAFGSSLDEAGKALFEYFAQV